MVIVVFSVGCVTGSKRAATGDEQGRQEHAQCAWIPHSTQAWNSSCPVVTLNRMDTLLTGQTREPEEAQCPDHSKGTPHCREKGGPQSVGEPLQSCKCWPGPVPGNCQSLLNLGPSCVPLRAAASTLSRSSLGLGIHLYLPFLQVELLSFNLHPHVRLFGG